MYSVQNRPVLYGRDIRKARGSDLDRTCRGYAIYDADRHGYRGAMPENMGKWADLWLA